MSQLQASHQQRSMQRAQPQKEEHEQQLKRQPSAAQTPWFPANVTDASPRVKSMLESLQVHSQTRSNSHQPLLQASASAHFLAASEYRTQVSSGRLSPNHSKRQVWLVWRMPPAAITYQRPCRRRAVVWGKAGEQQEQQQGLPMVVSSRLLMALEVSPFLLQARIEKARA